MLNVSSRIMILELHFVISGGLIRLTMLNVSGRIMMLELHFVISGGLIRLIETLHVDVLSGIIRPFT